MKNKKQDTEDQLPSFLKDLKPKGDGLRSPDATYFEELAERIIEGRQAQQKPTHLQLSHRQTRAVPTWWWALAASVLLLLWWSVNDNRTALPDDEAPMAEHNSWQNQLDELNEADLSAYIQENIQEFELEILLANND